MARKKRKIDKHYTITIASDYSGKKTKTYRCRFNFVRVGIISSILVLFFATALTVYLYRSLDMVDRQLENFTSLLKSQEDTINQMGIENKELEEKVEIFSNMLDMHEVEDEAVRLEKEERCIPNLFPIKGYVYSSNQNAVSEAYFEKLSQEKENAGTNTQTAVPTDSNAGLEEEIENEYAFITVFCSSQAADMVSAGDGVVVSVGEDALYGAYVIIDHGNDYKTVYRNNGDLKVDVGDSVWKGQIIFVNNEMGAFFGFQIEHLGNFVNTMDVTVTVG